MSEELVISRTFARRLVIVAQCLVGPRPATDAEGIMDVVGQLAYLQLDPINIVARSHLLVLTELEASEHIVRVRVHEQGGELAGPWFMHAELLPVLDWLEKNDWQQRTTLLSPFDNLICDRQRTARLFDFMLLFDT